MRHCPPISLGSGKLLAAIVGGYAAGRAEIAPAAGYRVIKMSGAQHESGWPDNRDSPEGLAAQMANHASYKDVAALWP